MYNYNYINHCIAVKFVPIIIIIVVIQFKTAYSFVVVGNAVHYCSIRDGRVDKSILLVSDTNHFCTVNI